MVLFCAVGFVPAYTAHRTNLTSSHFSTNHFYQWPNLRKLKKSPSIWSDVPLSTGGRFTHNKKALSRKKKPSNDKTEKPSTAQPKEVFNDMSVEDFRWRVRGTQGGEVEQRRHNRSQKVKMSLLESGRWSSHENTLEELGRKRSWILPNTWRENDKGLLDF